MAKIGWQLKPRLKASAVLRPQSPPTRTHPRQVDSPTASEDAGRAPAAVAPPSWAAEPRLQDHPAGKRIRTPRRRLPARTLAVRNGRPPAPPPSLAALARRPPAPGIPLALCHYFSKSPVISLLMRMASRRDVATCA